MQDFAGKKILLGLCGGVATYKVALLARALMNLGAQVRVVMTTHAQAFISPLLMQALTTHPVHTELFDVEAERGMGHIELAKWADLFVIAPATANKIAKCAQGIADDLLTTLYLAVECPVIFCPAMNQAMWSHPATQHNIQKLQALGAQILGPACGAQACGDVGEGRLLEPEDIIEGLRLMNVKPHLKNTRVVITAGPTQEPLDPVRYITNHSSGKMGYALARAAQAAGAEVVLISGPCALKVPQGIACISVVTASDMHEAVMNTLNPGDIFIGTAAVADYRSDEQQTQKIKKSNQQSMTLSLTPNIDIIASVASLQMARFIVGFAAETEDVLAYANQKRIAKKLDMVIANQVGYGLGFNKDENQVTIVTEHEQIALPLQQKTRLAATIIDVIARYANGITTPIKEYNESVN